MKKVNIIKQFLYSTKKSIPIDKVIKRVKSKSSNS